LAAIAFPPPPPPRPAAAAGDAMAAMRSVLNICVNLTNDRAGGGLELLASGGLESTVALLPRLAAAVGLAGCPGAGGGGAAAPAAGGAGVDEAANVLSAALVMLSNAVEVQPACAAALAPHMPMMAWLFSASHEASQQQPSAGGALEEVTEEALEAGERSEKALIVCPYAALLLACLLHAGAGGREAREAARAAMPGGVFAPLTRVVHRFLAFTEGVRTLPEAAAATLRAAIEGLREGE